MSRYFLPHIDRMAGYVPGEQPRAAASSNSTRTRTRILPRRASPRRSRHVLGEGLRRYPDPWAPRFAKPPRGITASSPDMILAGNGSDDL